MFSIQRILRIDFFEGLADSQLAWNLIRRKNDIPGLKALRTLCGVILAGESPPLIASSWYLWHKS